MMNNDYICGHCGEPCGVQLVDEGYGAYEYWGARGVHTDVVAYSDCCQADVMDSDGEEVSQRDLIRHFEENDESWDRGDYDDF